MGRRPGGLVTAPALRCPMRYALLPDVHANVFALRAVLEHMQNAEPLTAAFHLGDLVGYAPWPNETVELIRSFGIAGVAGNYDSTVALDYEHCGCRYEDPEQERLSHVSFQWTKEHCKSSTKDWLRTLPFRIDVRPEGGHAPGTRLILVHGTPTLNTLYWTDDRSDDFCLKMARAAGAKSGDVIAFGHTHVPWQREVEGILFVNAGSVGRPKDGDWRACYATLDFAAGRAETRFHRVEYDLEAAVRGIRESTLPDAFAEYLAAGGRPTESPA